jgi:nucleoside-diphosphate-sugar epimerase
MRIAILGATSQIAKDLVLSFDSLGSDELVLYARRPEAVTEWLSNVGLPRSYTVADFEAFSGSERFDALINFVGVGNPAQVGKLGASIMDITYEFDSSALQYLKRHPGCRYIFLSSGAVFGGGFASPADDQTCSLFKVNQLGQQDWYGVAKMYAEARHRALTNSPIVDLRVFSYFSHSADIEARFLIADILRSIRDQQVMQTSQENIVRDYVGPQEITQIIRRVLLAPPSNAAIDCFTIAPVQKIAMLERMRSEFGLRYELVEHRTGVVATGSKLNYYSKSRKATDLFGYTPDRNSLDVVLEQCRSLLSRL